MLGAASARQVSYEACGNPETFACHMTSENGREGMHKLSLLRTAGGPGVAVARCTANGWTWIDTRKGLKQI